MTVGELAEKLKTLPEDWPVCIHVHSGYPEASTVFSIAAGLRDTRSHRFVAGLSEQDKNREACVLISDK